MLNKLVLKFEETLYRHWTLETFRTVPFLRHLVLYLPRPQIGPVQVFHRYTESHKALLYLTFPELMLLNTGLRPIVILSELRILELRGEMVTTSRI